MMEAKVDFSNAKVGDNVTQVRKGTIVGFIDDGNYIKVLFDCDSVELSFSRDGKLYSSSESPTLFHGHIPIPPEAYIPPKRLPDLPIDTKVIVWNNTGDTDPRNRHFAGWSNDGKIYTWLNGLTSWSTDEKTTWDNWKLAE